jgi:phage tail-like protein
MDAGAITLPESLSYLPAFFRAEVETKKDSATQHPVCCLLQVFEANLYLIERIVETSQMLFDPEEVLLIQGKVGSSTFSVDWERGYMHWLASWVCISLDQEWLNDTGKDASRRYTKACAVIKEAAQLYRERGTRDGLTKIIKLFYDWEVEIVERSWPRGMEIGVSSAIGLNCWLVDEIDLDRQFTVLIRSTEHNRNRLPDFGSQVLSELAGQKKKRQIVWLSADPTDRLATDSGRIEKVVAVVGKLRDLIDREKPAHTVYFLALEPTHAPPKQPQLPPLVIGVDSKIEFFWID